MSNSVKESGVPAIFAETTTNLVLIKTVAQASERKLAPQELYSDSIAPGSEGETYVKMMVANTRRIVQALEDQYTAFKPTEKLKETALR